MKRRPPRTVLEVAVAKGGIRTGLRVSTFVAQWTIAQQQLGHEPTVEEAAAWWNESERTWFRRLAEFREVFDLSETPATIAARTIALQERSLERRDVATVLGSVVVA